MKIHRFRMFHKLPNKFFLPHLLPLFQPVHIFIQLCFIVRPAPPAVPIPHRQLRLAETDTDEVKAATAAVTAQQGASAFADLALRDGEGTAQGGAED
jgi:hypothetical protein